MACYFRPIPPKCAEVALVLYTYVYKIKTKDGLKKNTRCASYPNFHGNAVRISKLSHMFNESPHMMFKRFSPF